MTTAAVSAKEVSGTFEQDAGDSRGETDPFGEDPSAPLDVTAKNGSSGKQILLAEDEEELCEIVRQVFSLRGHSIVSVNSTGQALEAMREQHFDAVVSDLLMPGGGGRAILDAALSLTDSPPVVLVTGRPDGAVMRELLEHGAAACIEKPFELMRIVAIVEDAMQ